MMAKETTWNDIKNALNRIEACDEALANVANAVESSKEPLFDALSVWWNNLPDIAWGIWFVAVIHSDNDTGAAMQRFAKDILYEARQNGYDVHNFLDWAKLSWDVRAELTAIYIDRFLTLVPDVLDLLELLLELVEADNELGD